MPNDSPSLAHLPDAQLLEATRSLAARERRVTAELVAHLAELHRRRLVVAAGYSSLFIYCRDALGMSEGEAYNRSVVAEAACRFPAVVSALLEGSVTLTAVRLVVPHLTAENHARVLASIRSKKKAELEQIVAALAPKPDAKTLVRRLPAPAPLAAAMPAPLPEPPRQAAAAIAPPRAVTPTSPDRFRLQVTLDGASIALLRELKDLMRHAVPSGDEAEIVRRALALLHARVRKQRFAATERPRAVPELPKGDDIAAHVRRFVWSRDDGRCAFVSKSGHRCEERSGLEFHHRHPKRLGGPPTADNISLRCRVHNVYEAEVDYGLRNAAVLVTSAVPERRGLALVQKERPGHHQRQPGLFG